MAIGLTCWACGVLPYSVFVLSGGDLHSPAAWSQAGFLAAYPFWYAGLWLVRQPVVGASPRRRAETWLIELAVFVLIGIALTGLLWHDNLPASQNVAQLIPLALDLVLLHAVYTAVRRSSVTHRASFIWLAYGFGSLAVVDGTVTALVASSQPATVGFALAGYAVAMGFLTIATTHPLRITEAQAVLGPSVPLLATVGLALAGVASALAPPAARPGVWLIGLALLAHLWSHLRRQEQSDTDPLTGLLEARAFSRHVAGVTQLAAPERPAVLLAVDLDQFSHWNARHGVGEADELLAGIAGRLETALDRTGVWSRLGPDRFAWIGTADDPAAARALAEAARESAADNTAAISARAGFVMIPDDAPDEESALAAIDESLAAARAGRRRVVAFDRGRLDGVDYTAGYTASLSKRRDTILDILASPAAIDTLLQPIVSLDNGQTVGYEALARFRALPERSPDRWIAEAHAVGLGLEVEVECVRRACRLRDRLGPGTYLSLNMSPDAVLAPEMEDALGPNGLDGLVIEITEHEAVSDYGRLAARLADYRGRGAMVAIDDTGAGHASMRHVAQLAPDYIKVDRSLIHDLHIDHAKRALVRSMVTLERELGASIIAEGIERPEELRALRALGVPLGQGYLLGRPAAQPPAQQAADRWPALVSDGA